DLVQSCPFIGDLGFVDNQAGVNFIAQNGVSFRSNGNSIVFTFGSIIFRRRKAVVSLPGMAILILPKSFKESFLLDSSIGPCLIPMHAPQGIRRYLSATYG